MQCNESNLNVEADPEWFRCALLIMINIHLYRDIYEDILSMGILIRRIIYGFVTRFASTSVFHSQVFVIASLASLSLPITVSAGVLIDLKRIGYWFVLFANFVK